VVIVAAGLRFATLGTQSYWYDEAQAAHELHLSLWSMLSSMVVHETNPPLYFVLGWVWAHVFGNGAVALRSLSALAGTAAVLVAYLCGRELVSRRAGLLAATFAALSPFLIWYSQEAREYMLLTALAGASFLYFARVLRDPSSRNIAWWGLFSALALLTHFFAGFLIGPEAVWLLYAARKRELVIAVIAQAIVEAALVPLLVTHATASLLGFITSTPLSLRIEQVPLAFGLGTLYGASLVTYSLLGTAVLAGILILLLVVGAEPRELRGAGIAAALALAVLLLPLLAALLGKDYYIPRALIPAWIPLSVVVAAACTTRLRVPGAALAAVVLAGFVYAQIRVQSDSAYQRPDWRGVAAALGPATGQRAIVAYDGQFATDPLAFYIPDVPWTEPTRGLVRVGEVDVVGYTWQTVGAGKPLPRGVTLLGSKRVNGYLVDRFSLDPAWVLTRAAIAARVGALLGPAPTGGAVLVQTPRRPAPGAAGA
jgi:mannosyltransferase